MYAHGQVACVRDVRVSLATACVHVHDVRFFGHDVFIWLHCVHLARVVVLDIAVYTLLLFLSDLCVYISDKDVEYLGILFTYPQ